MAEDHVPRLARQFDHAKGDAVDDGFRVHESGDPVGGRRRLPGERHEVRLQIDGTLLRLPTPSLICRDPQARQEDPENHFSAGADGAYDPSVVTGIPAWREVQLLVTRELGEPVSGAGPLVPARRSGMTWAARAQRAGAIVVKVRHGDRAYEKTQWCAAHLPALGARGYPVPAILWHGMISAQWHATVQNQLPGRPLFAPGVALDGPLLDALLRLVELQADAGIPAGDRDFTGYVANVLLPTSVRRTAIPSGMRSARRHRPSSTGSRRPAAPYSNGVSGLGNAIQADVWAAVVE
jgi:hypothetical protein